MVSCEMEQAARQTRQRVLGYAACAGAGCLWGMGFYFGKLALREMGSNHMVLYRFLFACIGFLPVVLLHPARLKASEWRALLTASLLGIPVQFLVQFYGLSLTTVSHAALMVGTMPVILAAGAVLFAKERLDGLGWLALAGSTTGAALIVLGGKHSQTGRGPSLVGDLLIVLSLIVALGWILLNKRLMQTHSPIVVTAYGILSGTAMLIVFVVLRSGLPPVHGISMRAWGALAASGILCTSTSTLLWNWGIHHVPASRAGVFLNIEPALGSWLGVKLLGDQLGPHAWIGGALILAAAITLTTRGHEEIPALLE
ncbi:MAG TPA: EamA family transporter [Acidisarcina sp.]|nr:EamA family transporter [Acidisarcina sp.]